MAMIDPEHERHRLTEFYSGQKDGELEEVAHQGDELTDVARDVLRAELVKRGRYNGQLEQATEAVDIAEFRDLITVRTFSSLTEAELAKGMLQASGIESILFDENMGRIYWMNVVGGVRLRVDAANAEEARRALEEGTLGEESTEQFGVPDDNPST